MLKKVKEKVEGEVKEVKEKGIPQYTKDRFEEVDRTNRLCEHLRKIGVEAEVIDPSSPEAIHHGPTRDSFGTTLGCVKIKGRNLGLVEIYRAFRPTYGRPMQSTYGGGMERAYTYRYAVRTDIMDEDELRVETKPIKKRKGLFNQEVIDFEWVYYISSKQEKGRLAQLLNDDSELRNILLKTGMPHLSINPNKKDRYVGITPIGIRTAVMINGVPVKYSITVGISALPTREAIEAYDIIARHILSIAPVQH